VRLTAVRLTAAISALNKSHKSALIMKSLKVICTAIALSMVAAVPLALAQEKGRGGATPEQQIERIEQAVGSLTNAQKQKITAIIAKGRDDIQAVPKEQRKDKMGDLMRKQRDEIRKVLTPDQQKKYDAAAQKAGARKKN
jgi:Spy/CpxP family protein refolding chaperone